MYYSRGRVEAGHSIWELPLKYPASTWPDIRVEQFNLFKTLP